MPSQPLTQEALAEWHKQQIEMYNKIMTGDPYRTAVPVDPPPGMKTEEFDIDKGKTEEDSVPASVRLAPIASKALPIDLDDISDIKVDDKKEQ